MKATCYHMRNMIGVKVLGGSLSMAHAIDLNTAAAKLTAELQIVVLPSGRLSYAKDGTAVWVYLSLDPSETDKGKAVLRAHIEARDAADRKERDLAEAQDEAVNDAVAELGADKVIEILKQATKKDLS